MNHTEVELLTGRLQGDGIVTSARTLGQLSGLFEREDLRAAMDQNRVVYEVQSHLPVQEGTSGGLFFGTSCVFPGQVGDEYFMTKGHFHSRRECGEYYWGIAGEGALILMDENGRCWMEPVRPGSLHYIPGHVAHRLANTGSEPLRVGACWPSDAGHDYAAIGRNGFSMRLKNVAGRPMLVAR